ncbi:MAG: hypothetical protein M9962_13840 [Oligoflexia bacterium]|nr:hypothetical protein [Oligoflexia bacterium]
MKLILSAFLLLMVNTEASYALRKKCVVRTEPKNYEQVKIDSTRSVLVDTVSGDEFSIPNDNPDIYIVEYLKTEYPLLHESYFAIFADGLSTWTILSRLTDLRQFIVLIPAYVVFWIPDYFTLFSNGVNVGKTHSFKVKKTIRGLVKENEVIKVACLDEYTSLRKSNCINKYELGFQKLVYVWPKRYFMLPVAKEEPCLRDMKKYGKEFN